MPSVEQSRIIGQMLDTGVCSVSYFHDSLQLPAITQVDFHEVKSHIHPPPTGCFIYIYISNLREQQLPARLRCVRLLHDVAQDPHIFMLLYPYELTVVVLDVKGEHAKLHAPEW